MNEPIRLMIVDDHEVVRVGLRALLERCPRLRVVGEAGTVATAISEAARLQPDVILMDVRLTDGSGFDACREIQKLSDAPRVLILTSYADEDIVLQAINAGAHGYLLKEINAERLIESIEKVAAGQSILDPAITQNVLNRIKTGPESDKNLLPSLSSQEKRVLALVAEGKTNKEIATELGLSDKTVKNYFSNVLDKLGLTRRSQAAAYYMQHSDPSDRSL